MCKISNRLLVFSCVAVLLLMGSVACTPRNNSPENAIDVVMQPIDKNILIARPLDLEYVDNWLLWQDHYESYYYSGYKIKSKNFVRFAKVGKGAGEFANWPQGAITSFGFGIFDAIQDNYYAWELEKISIDSTYFPSRSVSLKDSLGVTFQVIQRPDSSFISKGPNPHGLFSFFSKEGELLGHSGEYPPKRKNISNDLHAIACLNSTYSYHPSKDKIVVGYIFSGIFDVFQLKDSSAIREWGVNKFPFEYEVNNGRVRMPLDSKYGYFDIKATDKFIYALFSGKDMTSNNSVYSDRIEVYDWDGNQVAVLKLNAEVKLIAINPDNRIMYATGIQDEEIQLLRAQLPVL